MLRPRSYQSVIIYRFFPSDLRPPSSQNVATLVCPSRLAPSKLQKYHYLFVGFSTRLAPSKLQKCRYLRVPFPFCPLEVTKVSLFIVLCISINRFFHPTCALEVTKVLLLLCAPPVLRPRSYQGVSIFFFSIRLAHSKLPKCRYFRVPLPPCALEVFVL